jgi:hypothetical protein
MNVVVLQLKLLTPEELMILANSFNVSALQFDARRLSRQSGYSYAFSTTE